MRAPRKSLLPLVLATVLSAGGCATTSPDHGGVHDPLEPVNRKVHAFNTKLDRAIMRPVARTYEKVVPGPISQAVTNFFNNLDDVNVLINSILQLKPRQTLITANRLVVNSTIGLYGLIDVVGLLGGPKFNEDFGQTLGYWGVGRGPYLVLPLLGPSNLRDAGGFIVDNQYDPINEIEPNRDRNAAIALQAVDRRARLLDSTDVLDTAAVDPYLFTREAFTRRRANQVYDGDPPPHVLPPDPAADEDEDFDPFSGDEDLFDEPAPDGSD